MLQPILFPALGVNSFGGSPAPFAPVLRTGFVDAIVVTPSPVNLRPILFALKGKGGITYPKGAPLPAPRLFISGVTKDNSGVVLGSCVVSLYRTIDSQLLETVISDASGKYSFSAVGLSETYYVVAYKRGAPDLAGTTVNTLVGA